MPPDQSGSFHRVVAEEVAILVVVTGPDARAARLLLVAEDGASRWDPTYTLATAGVGYESPRSYTFLGDLEWDAPLRHGSFAGVWLVKLSASRRIVAVADLCTKLGCSLTWLGDEKAWGCPCCGSRFGLRGEVVRGPAPAPLVRHPVRRKGKAIVIDLATRIEKSRWDEASAFVEVAGK